MASPVSQAVGVVEGTFIPEKGLVISKDGTTYPASCTPTMRWFFERQPEKAAKARFLVCYPRTASYGRKLHLTVAAAPTSKEEQADLKRRAGWFKVSGVVTNQRSRHNSVVVRVVRNQSVPKERRRWAEFKHHLLFLTGRASPFNRFVNKHTEFTCRLDGSQLRISGIEDTQEQEQVVIEAGGIKLPWPFQASQQSLRRLAELNKVGKGPFLAPADARERLEQRLKQLDALVAARAGLTTNEDHQATDRIDKIRERISKVTRRMGDTDLVQFLESSGLLTALAKLDVQATTTNPDPDDAMPTATAMPTVVLPKNLQKVADQLVIGAPDALIAMAPGMSTKSVKPAILSLMTTEGWWESLTPEQQAKAKKGSYQVRKALKKRG